MLAADHRWQWEEWCDAHGTSRERIREAKSLALDALLAARAHAVAVRRNGVLLVDEQYGGDTLDRARRERVTAGTPAEKPGVFPLEWTADPFWSPLTADFAKVLIHERPHWSEQDRSGQMEKLRQLARWCGERRKPLLLEVIIPRGDEPEEEFERLGRPAQLARVIGECYAAGVVPDFWKIEGTTDHVAMQSVDEAIAARPTARLLILGKGAGFDLIDVWFRAAAAARTAAGFAIGRSVYWRPSVDFLQGRVTRQAAVDAIAANYLRVVASWQANVSGPGSVPAV